MDARAMPGIHSCRNSSLFYEIGWRENQVLLFFNESTLNSSGFYTYHLCSTPLDSSIASSWQSVTKSEDSRYKFYVNDVFKYVPVHENGRVYSTFTIVIDPSSGNTEPVFDVIPSHPLLLHYDPNERRLIWNVTCHLRFDKVNSVYENHVSQKKTDSKYLIVTVIAFVPSLFLFMWYRKKFVSVTMLSNCFHLPFFYQNMFLFVAVGISELLSSVSLIYFDQTNAKTPMDIGNILLFIFIPVTILRTWFGSLTSSWLSEAEYTGFAYASIFSAILVPAFVTGGSRLLFGSFRGPPVFGLLVTIATYMGVITVITRTLGYYVWLLLENHDFPFRQYREEGPGSGHSILGGIVYGAASMCILYPALQSLLWFILGKSVWDEVLIMICEICLAAYAGFFGLLRTGMRLKNGRNWQTDHLTYQGYIVVFCTLAWLYLVFVVEKVDIWDFLSVIYCGAGWLCMVFVAMAIGVTGSYLASFSFMYLTVIRRFTGEREKPMKSLNTTEDLDGETAPKTQTIEENVEG